jgi:integral membrane protein
MTLKTIFGYSILTVSFNIFTQKNMTENREQVKKQLHRFRMVGIAEGISFLVLLLIAMPLKYIFKIPEAVKFTGWVHGALFVAYLWFAFEIFGLLKKSFIWFIKAVIAAFVPLGTFLFDRELKKDAALLEQSL